MGNFRRYPIFRNACSPAVVDIDMTRLHASLMSLLFAGALPVLSGSVAVAKPGGSAPEPLQWSESVQHSSRAKGRLGVQILSISPGLRAHFGAPKDAGVLVDRVVPKSAADKAGIRTGDVVIALNGRSISRPLDMIQTVNRLGKGGTLKIALIRKGKKKVVTASIEAFGGIDPFSGPSSMRSRSTQISPFADGGHDRLRQYRMPFPGAFETNDVLLQRIDELEKRLDAMEKRLPKKN